jgi:UDPglucose 6-dehydrogenase
MKLTIIGTGYVGLVTGTCFAEVGHQVICVDNDAARSNSSKRRHSHLRTRPGGTREEERGRRTLRFTNSTAEGVEKSDIIFIAVPTPPLPDGSVDLSFIEKVAREIAGAMTSYKIVVDKSTVPVKTGDKVAETIKRYCKAKVEFDVVSNPGVFPRRLCGRRSDEAGSRRHRRALAAPGRRDEGSLRTVPGADHRHGHQLGRTHQARGQLVSSR